MFPNMKTTSVTLRTLSSTVRMSTIRRLLRASDRYCFTNRQRFWLSRSVERDSMPPEMFLALNPFCSRMRVA